jgi:transcriptional regulator with XRE-family HTH domain
MQHRDETLCDVVTRLGWDHIELARLADVDPKTAARWLSGERQPYRRSAYRLRELLGRFGVPLSVGRMRRLLRATRQVWLAGAEQRACSVAIAQASQLADAVDRPCPTLARQAAAGATALTRLHTRGPRYVIRRDGRTIPLLMLPG